MICKNLYVNNAEKIQLSLLILLKVIIIVVVQNVQIYLNIGVISTSQVPEIRKKMEQSLIDRYGGIRC